MAQVDQLFGLFGDAQISWDAARAVGSIPATDKILTKKNHAIVKVSSQSYTRWTASQTCKDSVCPAILQLRSAQNNHWSQITGWCVSLAVLIPLFETHLRQIVDEALQSAYLVALTSLIKSVPKSTYSHEMSTVILHVHLETKTED